MNVETGRIYENWPEPVFPGERREDIVEVFGTREQVGRLSAAVKAKRRAENKRARKSRKRNR